MMSLSDKYRQLAASVRHIALARTIVPSELYAMSTVFEEMVLASRTSDKGNITTSILAVDFSEASSQKVTLTQNTLISLNNLIVAPNYLVVVGAFIPTFSGVYWPNNVAPTPTATAGKADVYEFIKVTDHIVGRAWAQGIIW